MQVIPEIPMYELDDYPVGATVMTPSGRRAVVKRHLVGQSKYDHFSRLVLQYEGGDHKDLVTLQPHLLRRIPPVGNVGMARHENTAIVGMLREAKGQISVRRFCMSDTYVHAIDTHNATEVHIT